MKEKLQEYITDKKELSLANEVLKKFESQKIINKIKNFSLSKVEIHGIGNLKNITHEFKESTLITGDREQGKSWFAESPLWALTNKCRTSIHVLGNGNRGRVKVWFNIADKNKYYVERTRTKTQTDVILFDRSKGDDISCNPDEVTNSLCEIFNFNFKDKDDLFNIFYFTPKISFAFSKKDPRDIESLIIKLTNNDIWLELESFAKEMKKEEHEKLLSINGVIEHISPDSDSEQDVKNKIQIYQDENKALNKDLKDLVLPSVDAVKKKMSLVKKKIEMIGVAENQIEEYKKSKEKKLELEKVNKEYVAQINHYESMKNIMKNAEEKLSKLQSEQMDVVSQGKSLRSKLEEIKNMVNTDKCPILKIPCDKLNVENKKLKKEIDNINAKISIETKKYKALDLDIKKIEKELTESYDVEKKIHHVKVTFKENQEEIKRLDMILKGDLMTMKAKAKQIGDQEKLKAEYEKIMGEYESITERITEISDNRNEVTEKIIENNSQIESLQKVLDNFSNFQKYINDKNKLESRQLLFEKIIKLFGKKGIPKEESAKSINKMNQDIAYFLENLSGDALSAQIDDKFKMEVDVRSIGKSINPKLVSDGQEWIVNLSFVLACAKLVSNKAIPFFVFDDCFAFQNDKDGETIINAFLKFKEEGYLNQFMLISNRSKIMGKFKDKVDDYLTIKDGEIK